jgi:hypothetical protein
VGNEGDFEERRRLRYNLWNLAILYEMLDEIKEQKSVSHNHSIPISSRVGVEEEGSVKNGIGSLQLQPRRLHWPCVPWLERNRLLLSNQS